MQPTVTFYSNELSQFLSGKECKKSSCHTKIATSDTFCIKHHFKFVLQLIYSNNMAGDEFNQKIWPRVSFETINMRFPLNWPKSPCVTLIQRFDYIWSYPDTQIPSRQHTQGVKSDQNLFGHRGRKCKQVFLFHSPALFCIFCHQGIYLW